MNYRSSLRVAGVFLLAFFLAGCPSSDDDGGGASSLSTDTQDFEAVSLIADQPSVGTSGDDATTVIATVLDDSNRIVEDESVNWSVTGGRIEAFDDSTDAAGTAEARVSAGNNARNRTITVTATARGQTASFDINATGTTLNISGPSAIGIDDPASFTIRLSDSSGSGIADQPVILSSSSGTSMLNLVGNNQTGTDGRVQVEVTGDVNTVSPDTLEAEAFGENASRSFEISDTLFRITQPSDQGDRLAINATHDVTVNWQDGGTAVDGQPIKLQVDRGEVVGDSEVNTSNGEADFQIESTSAGPVTITATANNLSATRSADFVATEPDKISARSEPSQINSGKQSTITATVRDANDNRVTGANVDFRIVEDPTLGSISNSSVETDLSGRARTTFEAGDSDSGTDGVTVEAEVTPTIVTETSLTVTGETLRISLGRGNVLQRGEGEFELTDYSDPWTVIVTDTGGSPVTNRDVELNLRPVNYIRGSWDGSGDTWVPNVTATCENEDVRGDGVYDPDLDLNNSGSLTPQQGASVDPGSLETDSSGRAAFRVNYSQTQAQWLQVRLTATVPGGDGTEFTDSAVFVLPALADDTNNTDEAPPGGSVIGWYGDAADCTTPPPNSM